MTAAEEPRAASRLRWFRVPPYPVAIVITCLELVLWVRCIHPRPGNLWVDAARCAMSLVPVWALTMLAQATLWRRKWPFAVLQLGMLTLYSVLVAFRLDGGTSLGWGLLHDNINELFSRSGLGVILSGTRKYGFAALAFGVVVFVVLEHKTAVLTRARVRSRTKVALGSLALLVVSCRYATEDEAIYLAKDFYRYYLTPKETPDQAVLQKRGIDPELTYPLVRSLTVNSPSERPNIVMVAVESLNGNFVGAKSPEGEPYTPELDALRPQGTTVRRFYGNSIQTAKGHCSILCSVFPSMQGKIFSRFPDLRMNCLPSVLAELGYETLFFQGHYDIAFDHTGDAMKRIGFQEVTAVDGAGLTRGPIGPEDRWGWGVQDDILFEHVLERLDRGAAERPAFTFVATISSHWPFDEVPVARRALYKNPKDMRQRYANALRVADHAVGAFVRQLRSRERFRNSIIIVVGDHSYPIDEHGNDRNDIGSYEENFRTHLWLDWPGHLPARELPIVASQVDLAPTVLDLIGSQRTSHYVGMSLFGGESAKHGVLLVQPYDGTHLSVVRFPWKLTRHLRSGDESLVNLESDPHEDGLPTSLDAERLSELRGDLAVLVFNQQLIEQNRIWH